MPVVSETTLARGRLGHPQALSSPGGHQPEAATSQELPPAFCCPCMTLSPCFPLGLPGELSSSNRTPGGTLVSPGSSLTLALICCSVSPPVLSETTGLLLPRMSKADISQQSGSPTVAVRDSLSLCAIPPAPPCWLSPSCPGLQPRGLLSLHSSQPSLECE